MGNYGKKVYNRNGVAVPGMYYDGGQTLAVEQTGGADNCSAAEVQANGCLSKRGKRKQNRRNKRRRKGKG